MKIKPGDVIMCKDETIYQVILNPISNEYALVDLDTYTLIQPDVIPTFLSMYHLGVEWIEDIYDL